MHASVPKPPCPHPQSDPLSTRSLTRARARRTSVWCVQRRAVVSWAPEVVPAAVFAVLGVADVFAQLAPPSGDAPERTALVPVLVVVASLLARRRAPLASTLVIVAVVVLPTLAFQVRLVYWGEFVPWLFVLFSLGRHTSRRQALLGLAASVAGFALLTLHFPDLREPGNAIYDLGLMVIACAVGIVVRSRSMLRRENARLAEEHARAAAQAVEAERARLARELHDVVAHGIGVIVLQAGGARLRFDQDPEAAREALRRIEATGRDSLTELRLLLEVLRHTEVEEQSEVAEPQPTLHRLAALAADTRELGVPVELSVAPGATELPMGLQLSVYRIVQEALTNVVKHAGRASTHVDVSCDGSLVVAVSNARGGAPDVPSSSGGHGLLGLAERVSVLGGTLRTGATNDGGFRLVAEIPLTAEVR